MLWLSRGILVHAVCIYMISSFGKWLDENRSHRMTRKVHPNAAAPAREPPRIASCCGGDDAWGKDNAAVLTVWRKSLLFSCSGFTVFDAKGDLVFRVETYGSGTAGELVLMDAAGKPLLTLRRKVRPSGSMCC